MSHEDLELLLPPCDPLPEVSQTDLALEAWRETTVERREQWERAQASARAAARRRVWVAAMAGSAAFAIGAGSLIAWRIATRAEPAPQVEVAAVSLPEAPPKVVALPTQRLPPHFDAGVLPDSLKVFRADDHVWTQFDYAHGEPIELRWRDAAGSDVLDPWRCFATVGPGVRRCYVGRSEARLQAEVSAGAVPGGWTVRACEIGEDACQLVAVFLVADDR